MDGVSEPRRKPLGETRRFRAAAVVPFLPVLYLFVKGPKQTLFNIIQYNLIFRQVEWPDAISHDIFAVMIAWLEFRAGAAAGPDWCLRGCSSCVLAATGRQNQRAEFYLCGWLALALGVHISSAHPTFQRYYLLALPFVVILAAAGLYFLTARLYRSGPAFLADLRADSDIFAGVGESSARQARQHQLG